MTQQRVSVLFVDDEIQVLNALKRGLLDQNYTSFFASSGKDALKILEKQKIAVIVTDMRMPEMNGLQLLREVDRVSPKTVKIVLTGYTQVNQILATVNSVHVFRFVTKPWDLEEELIGIIQQAIDYYLLEETNEQLKLDLEKKNEAYQRILTTVNNKVNSVKRHSAIIGSLGHEMLAFANEHGQKEDPAFRFLLSIQTAIFDAVIKTTELDEDMFEMADVAERVTEKIRALINLNPIKAHLPERWMKVNVNLIVAYFRVALLVLREETKSVPMTFETEYTGTQRLSMTLKTAYTDMMGSKTTEERIQYINRVMGSSARAGGLNCYAEIKEDEFSITVLVPVGE